MSRLNFVSVAFGLMVVAMIATDKPGWIWLAVCAAAIEVAECARVAVHDWKTPRSIVASLTPSQIGAAPIGKNDA